ncbi:MAG: GspMb/PilO family protein [Kiritimatiellales bacterium]
MNNLLARLSRRERLYILIAVVALLAGGIIYPAIKASSAYREEKIEELEAARSLRDSYETMLRTAGQIREENEGLKEALTQVDGLLFDRTGNDVMMEASIIKLLNQMAPDLSLEISQTRTSLHSVPGQMNFSVKGTGRYPEILNFFYQLETHRPLMVIDEFNIAVQNGRRRPGQPGAPNRPMSPQMAAILQRRAAMTASAEPTEPKMRLQMEIHINCRVAEEEK